MDRENYGKIIITSKNRNSGFEVYEIKCGLPDGGYIGELRNISLRRVYNYISKQDYQDSYQSLVSFLDSMHKKIHDYEEKEKNLNLLPPSKLVASYFEVCDRLNVMSNTYILNDMLKTVRFKNGDILYNKKHAQNYYKEYHQLLKAKHRKEKILYGYQIGTRDGGKFVSTGLSISDIRDYLLGGKYQNFSIKIISITAEINKVKTLYEMLSAEIH